MLTPVDTTTLIVLQLAKPRKIAWLDPNGPSAAELGLCGAVLCATMSGAPGGLHGTPEDRSHGRDLPEHR